jgi:TM2 domain-containing membrane protein YozV
MNLPATQPPRCRSCQAILQPPGHVCSQCNTVQQLPPQAMMQVSTPPKSVGVAVLLSFLWLGAGHIYAGRMGSGIALAIFDGFLVLLALTGIGLIIAVPVWLIATPVAMALSASAVNQSNRRSGSIVS